MVQRITGLASGMDIDTMVQKMMAARRIPVDKMNQNKQTLQWQTDAYRDINLKLNDFRNNKLSNYRLEGAYSAKTVAVTGDSVIAKATSNATPGTMDISVTRVAIAANTVSGDIRSTVIGAPALDQTKDLSTQSTALANPASATDTLTINGKVIMFDSTRTVNGSDSLNIIIDAINKSDAGVSAFYDSLSGKLGVTAKNTGLVNGTSANSDTISFSGNLATTLKLNTTNGAVNKLANNADYTLNGVNITNSTSNNVNQLNVNITLVKSGVSTITVKSDADAIVNQVKSFVTDYNDIIKTFNDKINEPTYLDFKPLTDNQRKNMKDVDITNWETKAKSGLLKGDNGIQKVLSDMRFDVMTPVNINGKDTTLASIGITSGTWQEKGKLYIDETKLRKAIEDNPDVVSKLLAGKGSDYAHTGVAVRMYDDTKKELDTITAKVGTAYSSFNSVIGKQLTQLNTEINKQNIKMTSLETMYYNKFSAMEKAISKFNSQSAQLASAFK
ncbi:flagellar filament capping protein FliD [Paenibacillus sp. GP183]|uniref:flagellar filament capping protein FliD n=1 Tax=Paenibacillus sp. GP183 TaxID=1882751 RepID=UPI000897B736|nr:flagellar filament capping protein FliD [Paenibacillus sp. GP183]SEC34443.1 flagellar hook-associated protein 2 [Paenibacillus sp. GP183]